MTITIPIWWIIMMCFICPIVYWLGYWTVCNYEKEIKRLKEKLAKKEGAL